MMSKILTGIIGTLLLSGSATRAAEPLVSTEWMAKYLNDPKVRLIEVSVEPGVFERGHIPGAVNFRWHTDLCDPLRRDIVSQQRFEELLSAAGIAPDTTVVLYGDHNNWFAAWGAWIFEYYGHADTRLLDGGRNKWEKEKRPLSTSPAAYRRTEYKVTQTQPALRARLADVLAAVQERDNTALVDIRSPEEYTGKIIAPPGVQELSIRAGHVPGAVNVPWSRAVNPADGTFKSADELRELYASVGVDGSKPVIVYCRIGERSSHTWFALHRLLGYEVRNYDGSWTEYGNTVGVPIENPAGTIWTGK
jgi:thiosulfate/3-mercaptopyruvate sulfurtransferase